MKKSSNQETDKNFEKKKTEKQQKNVIPEQTQTVKEIKDSTEVNPELNTEKSKKQLKDEKELKKKLKQERRAADKNPENTTPDLINQNDSNPSNVNENNTTDKNKSKVSNTNVTNSQVETTKVNIPITEQPKPVTQTNNKKDTKPQIMFFCLSSYEEIVESRAIQETQSNDKIKSDKKDREVGNFLCKGFDLSLTQEKKADKEIGKSFIKTLNKIDTNHFMNEDFYKLLLFLQTCKLSRQMTCCKMIVETFTAFCKTKYDKFLADPNKFSDLKQKYDKDLELNINYLKICKEAFDKLAFAIRSITYSMGGIENTLNYINRVFSELFDYTKQMNLNEIKDNLIGKLEEYANIRLIKAKDLIVNFGIGLIKPGDKILIYGLNSYFKRMFFLAAEKKIPFSVVYIAIGNNTDSQKDIEFLSEIKVPVTFTYIVSISCIINEVTKVFLRAKSMLSNGSFISDVGNSLIANLSYNFKKPVIVFSETFKFWDKIQLDSLTSSNLTITKEETNKSISKLNIMYDVTSAKVLNMVVCEIGYIPPSSVKVVIREYVSDEKEIR